ncbi:MAG: polyprenyl synthetase family protein [Bacteroidales bacterium]|nr:polyprenyl synthetase family protein [Bacteroidales bacterium]MBO6248191.1 polyprenyl synthetase family protein [Bacteroidales bacterium]MBR1926619.1 polyprenyl synthetase family protein [Bacteroidales bacterium]
MIRQNTIDEAIRSLFENIAFTSEPSGLYDPLRYMIEIGGKRLRPRLCLTTYSLYKDRIGAGILEPAAGLEVFHSFTLIHDDIMDRSPLRRGVDTVWKKWSPDTAILSGDVMCIDSYSRIMKAPRKVQGEVLTLFSRTAAQVCEGQQYDMEFECRDDVTMEEYMNMIGLKTGVLIACAAKMGALIGGAPKRDCDTLYGYGFNLGLAFQVADDYLDAFGDEKVFGKPIGGDIVNSKKSWLTIRAYEKASTEQAERLTKAMSMPARTDQEKVAKIAAVKEIYSELGVAEDAQTTILELNAKALEAAAKICKGVRYERLRRFADRLIGRTK